MIKHKDRVLMVVELTDIEENDDRVGYTVRVGIDKEMPQQLLVDVFSSTLETWRALLDERKIKGANIETFDSFAEMVRTYQN